MGKRKATEPEIENNESAPRLAWEAPPLVPGADSDGRAESAKAGPTAIPEAAATTSSATIAATFAAARVAAGKIPSLAPIKHRRLALLAASMAIAAALGALSGSLAGLALGRALNEPADAKTFRQTIAQLRAEITSLKATVDGSGKNASAQPATTRDRIERAEKAQADASAKFARPSENVDPLERKSAEITGSVAEKQQQKPPVVEGWILRDIFDGRALVESRSGLYEIAPGSNLPGIGRVETIKRQDGRWVVVTPRGIILSSR